MKSITLFCKHDSHWSQPIPCTQGVHGSIPSHEFFKTKLNFRLTSKGDEGNKSPGVLLFGRPIHSGPTVGLSGSKAWIEPDQALIDGPIGQTGHAGLVFKALVFLTITSDHSPKSTSRLISAPSPKPKEEK